MSTTVRPATAPAPAPAPTGVGHRHPRPGLGRLVAVELRKMLDTRAGFWLPVAMVALTAVAVTVRLLVGDATTHTFPRVLDIGMQPAAILLPVLGILLVTSEWTQRTGLITFVLVPARSRVLGAKLVASFVFALAMFAVAAGIVAAGVFVTSSGVAGAWEDAVPLLGQSAVYVTTGMVTGVAYGALLQTPAPAIVLRFALPTAWSGVMSISALSGVAPWVDEVNAIGKMTIDVLSPTEWAQVGSTLALWMVLPLLAGAWRIARGEVTA